MKKNRRVTAEFWQLFGLVPGACIVFAGLLIFRLGALTHHRLSHTEYISHTSDSSLHNIVHNPINSPYKILDFAFMQINMHSAAYGRISSVVFALIALALFAVIMLRWHGRRAAIYATVLFGASGWLLHAGRLGDGHAPMLVIPLALILFASWLNTTDKHGPALLYMTLASVLALLTPGAVWFLLAAYLLIWRAIIEHITEARVWEKILSIIVILSCILLLAYTLYNSPLLYKAWLDLPATWPTPTIILKQWLDSAAYLFVRGPSDPVLWLPHMPILDIFTSLMALVGAYFYATHYKNLRTHVLVAFLAIGSVLVALNGATNMSYIVPVAYLLAGTGVTFVLRRWLIVFPRNPLARGLGIGLIGLVVVAASLYHARSYFVAWTYSPPKVAAFRDRL